MKCYPSTVKYYPYPGEEWYERWERWELSVLHEMGYDAQHIHAVGWRTLIREDGSRKEGVIFEFIPGHARTRIKALRDEADALERQHRLAWEQARRPRP